MLLLSLLLLLLLWLLLPLLLDIIKLLLLQELCNFSQVCGTCR